MLCKIGKSILAQARLLVSSVKAALVTITTKMTTNCGAPIIKLRNVAIVPERFES